MNRPPPSHDAEQQAYARVLVVGVRLGLALLIASFLLYVGGVIDPLIPLDQLPRYWGLPIKDFVRVTHAPTGWSWVAQLAHGDVINLLGITLLASLSALASLAVLPGFVRRGDLAQALIAALQIVVLAVAASDVLSMLR